MWHKTRVLTCGCALLLTSACVPSTGEADKEFGENSPMAAIQAEGELVVAIPPDSAPFASTDASGEPQGFVVDLAEYLATELEVDAEFIEASPEEMPSLVAGSDPREIGDEEADLAFPLTTITNQIYKADAGATGFDVTTPYFVAHQRILVPSDSEVEDVDDLEGKVVCSLVDPEVGVAVEELQPEAEVEEASTPRECADALEANDVDAAVADEVMLLRTLAELEKKTPDGYVIVGEQTTTQGYAPYVVRGMDAFASDVFNDVKDDGRWLESYDSWIAELTGDEEPEPPALTLEEAAALYPEVVPPE